MLTTKQNRQANYWLLPVIAFIIPFMLHLFSMILRGYYPFGRLSYIIYDQYHQYLSFFMDFQKSIRENGALPLINWHLGLGTDNVGLYAYYLASPLNWISVLLPENMVLTFYTFLLPIRIGLASAFCTTFLIKYTNKPEPVAALFGCMYGMCAWSLSYNYHSMWLDAFALLPLVALGLYQMMEHKKTTLYICALGIAVLSNYYIGFMLCIFCCLAFAAYHICKWNNIKAFVVNFLRFAGASLLAVGMTAIVLFPAAYNLLSASAVTNGTVMIDLGFKNILDFLNAVIESIAQLTPFQKFDHMKGGPYISAGMCSLMLTIIYLTTKSIPVRRRIVAGGLVGFILLCTAIPALDLVWHGFRVPHEMHHRYSFIISFLLISCGYMGWVNRTKIKTWQIFTSAGICAALTFLSDNRQYMEYVIWNLLLILMTTLALYMLQNDCKVSKDAEKEDIHKMWLQRKKSRKQAATIFLCTILMETIFVYCTYNALHVKSDITNHTVMNDDAKTVIDTIQREDKSVFYRMEFGDQYTTNDSAALQYNGVSAFTSTANSGVTAFMEMMGAAARVRNNRYILDHQTPLASSFLAQKYVLNGENQIGKTEYRTEVYRQGDIIAYQNEAYLPLGFMANAEIKEYAINPETYKFLQQNEFYKSATGISEPLWQIIQETENTSEVIEISDREAAILNAGDNSAIRTYHVYKPNQSGVMAISAGASKVSIPYNLLIKAYKVEDEIKTQIFAGEYYQIAEMYCIGDVYAGETILIETTLPSEADFKFVITCAIMNNTVFDEGLARLSDETWQITEFESEKIVGDIAVEDKGLMYTSIPAERGWKAYVDGREVAITKICDAFIGIEMDPGSHTVELRYENIALNIGIWVSLGCTIGFAANLIAQWRKKRHV